MGPAQGLEFWQRALDVMGIPVLTPPEQVALIPRTGPVVVVANHPSGLVDGLVMARLVMQVRCGFQDPHPLAADRHPRDRLSHGARALPA